MQRPRRSDLLDLGVRRVVQRALSLEDSQRVPCIVLGVADCLIRPLVEGNVFQFRVAHTPGVGVVLHGEAVDAEVMSGETGEAISRLDPLAVAKGEGGSIP